MVDTAALGALLRDHAGALLGVALLLLLYAAWLVWRLRRGRRHLRERLVAANSELSDLRGRDSLTGLVGRAEFESALAQATLATDHAEGKLCVAYIGLDGFRGINEGYGLRVGDTVLVEVARRLSGWMGQRPHVARIGGDEFVLFLSLRPNQSEGLAEALQALLGQPIEAEVLSLQLGLSIGLALYPDDGARTRLVSHAALAMRAVKLTGGNGYSRFHTSMAVDNRNHIELLQDLRQALARGQFRLVYQPKIDARSLQVTAAEALLRWEHPQRGVISPAVFVPMAERHGLIRAIGGWVIEEAARQAAQWRELGLRMRIAVNISGHQLRSEGFVGQVLGALQRHGIPAHRLTCEITESVAMEDTEATRHAFERMRQAGLHVSIDDFGQGQSSLGQLRQLAAAELKIDRAFVADLASGEKGRSIVVAIVQMSRSLGLRVVAEGVETTAQRDELVALGCDELQGYLFAKPMSATALALWAEGDGQESASAFRPSLFDPTAPAPLFEPTAPAPLN